MHPSARIDRRSTRCLFANARVGAVVVLLAAFASSCGGGGGGGGGTGWLFPLWVPTDIAIVDFDGDGRADVLTLAQLSTSMSHREGRVGVRLQQAGGGFSAAVSYAVETYPWHFAIADVDGDGALDVVVCDPDANAVTWLRQDPAARGRLLAPVRLISGVAAYDVAVADLDDDGVVDVVASDAADRAVLLLQDPTTPGSFAPAIDIPTPGPTDAVAAGDLDADGLTDLAVGYSTRVSSTRYDRTLATLSQTGAGFSAARDLVTRSAYNVARLRLRDYDGDGTLDVISYLFPSESADPLLVAVSLPPGGVPAVHQTSLRGVNGRDDAAFGDLDGDGRLDAAVAGFYPVGSPSRVEARLSWFRQDAGGALVATTHESLPLDVSRLSLGDVDGDGHVDVALLGPEDRVLLMLQTSAGVGAFLPPQELP